MNNGAQRKPGIVAWLVMDLFAAGVPVLLLVLVSLADSANRDKTLQVLVGYSLILVVAVAIFITSLGNVLFHRISADHWQIVAGLIIGIILVATIGVGVSKYFGTPLVVFTRDWTVWLLLQISILLGVLFYCAALKSWMLQQLENGRGEQDETD